MSVITSLHQSQQISDFQSLENDFEIEIPQKIIQKIALYTLQQNFDPANALNTLYCFGPRPLLTMKSIFSNEKLESLKNYVLNPDFWTKVAKTYLTQIPRQLINTSSPWAKLCIPQIVCTAMSQLYGTRNPLISSLNRTTPDQKTRFEHAVQEKCERAVKHFIPYLTPANYQPDELFHLFQLAIDNESDCIGSMLLEYFSHFENPDIQTFGPIFQHFIKACKLGLNQTVEKFLQIFPLNLNSQLNKIVPEHAPSSDYWYGETLLHLVASWGQVSIMKIFLEKKPNIEDTICGETPFLKAVESGHVPMVELLLRAGADPEARDDEGLSPLHHAVIEGHNNVVKVFIKEGANLEIQELYGKATPLHYAAECGHVDIVDTLIDAKVSLEARDEEEQTPLFYSATYCSPQTLKRLLELGANPECRDNELNTPLHWAVQCDDLEDGLKCIEHLLDAGLKVNAENKQKETPLSIAKSRNVDQFVQLLSSLKRKVPDSDDETTPRKKRRQ